MRKRQPAVTQKQYRNEYLEEIKDMNIGDAIRYISKELNDAYDHRHEGFKWHDLYTKRNWELTTDNQIAALKKIHHELYEAL